jgi:hypothetical protein
MTGKIENTPGMINQDTGMINDNAGLIESSTGMINENTGLITETNDIEHTASGRRKRSRERGKDSKPRNYPLHTMKNLPQFRDKSHEEVRQYILEKKGVDIGSNFSSGSLMLYILVILLCIVGVIGIVKWLQQRQEKKK